MKKYLTAFWKILVLTIVFFIANAIAGAALPLTHDMMAEMTASDQAAFIPMFFLNIFINTTVMYLMLLNLRFKGWKLFLSVWMTFWGIFTVLNAIELYWYNESFPLFTYMDVTKMIIISLIAYGITSLTGVLLVKGFKREEAVKRTVVDYGKYGWKAVLFSVVYAPFYYCCGFITRLFPKVIEFYSDWAMTMEPLHILLFFNVFRGALWLLFMLPVLIGAKTRKTALWLTPLVLFTGTAVAVITPSAVMPGIVRTAHFIELGFSMIVVGLFMAWLLVKGKEEAYG